MRQLINLLVVLAAVSFVVGAFARFIIDGPLLGHEPVVYWRGAVGLMSFAIVLLLMQIRDK